MRDTIGRCRRLGMHGANQAQPQAEVLWGREFLVRAWRPGSCVVGCCGGRAGPSCGPSHLGLDLPSTGALQHHSQRALPFEVLGKWYLTNGRPSELGSLYEVPRYWLA